MNTFTPTERRRKHLARLNSRFRAVLNSFERISRRNGGQARTTYYATEMAESLAAYLDGEEYPANDSLWQGDSHP